MTSLLLQMAVPLVWAASFPQAVRPSEAAGVRMDCTWSAAWQSAEPRTDSATPGITPATRRTRDLYVRPRPDPGQRFSITGPWMIAAVVDPKGRVIDARVLGSAIEPPWPRYEGIIVKAVRKWRYTPALLEGKPVTFCEVLQIQDR
jgi:hypothetical protein